MEKEMEHEVDTGVTSGTTGIGIKQYTKDHTLLS